MDLNIKYVKNIKTKSKIITVMKSVKKEKTPGQKKSQVKTEKRIMKENENEIHEISMY